MAKNFEKYKSGINYVGITGFKTKKEVENVGHVIKEIGMLETPFSDNWRVVPMFGFLSSFKRMQNVWEGGTSSAAIVDLKSIIEATPDYALPMVHYSTPNKENLADEVIKLFEHLYGDVCDGLQINMAWPQFEQVDKIKQKFPFLEIVLQLPHNAMKDKSIDEIAQKVAQYNRIGYVLVDPSGGKGTEFDINECTKLLQTLQRSPMPASAARKPTLCIAGGFSGDNVYNRVIEIGKNLEARFSIDAQGKLRTDDNENLDINKCKQYLLNSTYAMRWVQEYVSAVEDWDRR